MNCVLLNVSPVWLTALSNISPVNRTYRPETVKFSAIEMKIQLYILITILSPKFAVIEFAKSPLFFSFEGPDFEEEAGRLGLLTSLLT